MQAEEEQTPRGSTPSEVLIKCLEMFGESEPEGVLVVFITADEVITVGNVKRTQGLGMLDVAHNYLLTAERPR